MYVHSDAPMSYIILVRPCHVFHVGDNDGWYSVLTYAAVVWVSALDTLMLVAVGTLAASVLAAGAVQAGRVPVTRAACDVASPHVLLQCVDQRAVIGRYKSHTQLRHKRP